MLKIASDKLGLIILSKTASPDWPRTLFRSWLVKFPVDGWLDSELSIIQNWDVF
jgi:hypothetical protein